MRTSCSSSLFALSLSRLHPPREAFPQSSPLHKIRPRVCNPRHTPHRFPHRPRSGLPSRLTLPTPYPSQSTCATHATTNSATLIVAVALSIGVGLWGSGTLSRETPPDQVVHDIDPSEQSMAGELPPGRPGNLTAEQEVKLQQMWETILHLLGVDDGSGKSKPNGTASADIPETHENAPKKKKFRVPVFSKKDKESSGKGDGGEGAIDINEKYGQKQEYQDAILHYKPEQLREMFWTITKQDNPDAYVLRFLRARKWDVSAATVMLFSTIRWNIENHVQDRVVRLGEGGQLERSKSTSGSPEERKDAEDFMAQLRLGKSFLYGTDIDGRPCCYVRVRLHHQGEQTERSLEDFTIHTIETARMMLRPSVDTATIIFDMTSFSLANMDYTPVKFMIKCFEANYPESLGRVVVYKAPWIFQSVWKIIKGWLDPVVAGKSHFASTPDALEDSIPRSRMIAALGGDDPYEYRYEEPLPTENARLHDAATRAQLLRDRDQLAAQYEDATRRWIADSNPATAADRAKITTLLTQNYWRLDPYVRARSLYDRLGVIGPHGELDFDQVKSPPPKATPNGSSPPDPTP